MSRKLDLRVIGTIARKEIGDSLRNRWFLLYSIAFLILTLAMSWVSLVDSGSFGAAGFGRTAAGLVNLVLLIVPLMGLSLGAASLAGERERGTLSYLLAQPVSRVEILLGKFSGLSAAILASLAVGFGVSAAIIAWRSGGSNPAGYAVLVGLTFALALAMLGIGFCISTLAGRTTVAHGAAISAWLVFVFLSDLGMIGGTLAMKLEVQALFRLAVANPLQVFKMSVLDSLHASLDLLGPVGIYASRMGGPARLGIFGGSLLAWTLIPLGLALVLFRRRSRA